MNGPVPIGFSAKALALSSGVAPAVASNCFCGMIALLNVASAAVSVGSGFLSFSVTVLPLPSIESMEASDEFHAPALGSRARSSDHFTSCAVIAAPSENFTPSRRVSVSVLPSADVSHLVARPGWTPTPSAVGVSSVS